MRNITNDEIIRQVQVQGSVNGAAKALELSWQTVSYALNGKRKGPQVATAKAKNLCTCCRQAPRGEGKRWLCEECYQSAECGVIYPETRAWV